MTSDTAAILRSISAVQAESSPYPHWLLSDVLTEETCDGIRALPVTPPTIYRFDGTREGNNDTRSYFNPDTCARFPVCAGVVASFQAPEVRAAFERTCGIDLSAGRLRIEYTLDTDGFWLESHCDITVKLFTMLIYLSKEPELADAGTDVYDEQGNHVKRAPYGPNLGFIFIPGKNTWHGFTKRPIRGVRRSLIVNYVTDAWRDRWELA